MKVRNADGDMVPLGSVVNIRDSVGPLTVTRYNMFPAATITGGRCPAPAPATCCRHGMLADKNLPRP